MEGYWFRRFASTAMVARTNEDGKATIVSGGKNVLVWRMSGDVPRAFMQTIYSTKGLMGKPSSYLNHALPFSSSETRTNHPLLFQSLPPIQRAHTKHSMQQRLYDVE